MEEYHERRHLFVHRLGRPDTRYRKTYHFASHRLSVDETYLLGCFNHFRGFIDAIDQYFKEWLPSIGRPAKGGSRASVTYKMAFSTAESTNFDFVQDSFTFWSGDELHSVTEILEDRRYLSDRECEVKIVGETSILVAYDRLVRVRQRSQALSVERLDVYGMHEVRKILPAEFLDRVKEALPPQPWPKSVHKAIALKLNCSNSMASMAIQTLIFRGTVKPQQYGRVID